jgi:hypothetical protein
LALTSTRAEHDPQRRDSLAGQRGLEVRQGAGSFGVGARTTHVRDASELEAVISPQAHEPTVALIVLNEDFTTAHRMEIVSLATCYRLPPVYPFRSLLNSVASSPTAST